MQPPIFLSPYNLKRIQSTIILIDEIVSLGERAHKKFPKAQYSLPTSTFINYLERFVYSLQAVSVLMKEYPSKPHLETSIGLIIRTSLLDYMTVAYIATYIQDLFGENPEEKKRIYEKQFASILCDHLAHFKSYLSHFGHLGPERANSLCIKVLYL